MQCRCSVNACASHILAITGNRLVGGREVGGHTASLNLFPFKMRPKFYHSADPLSVNLIVSITRKYRTPRPPCQASLRYSIPESCPTAALMALTFRQSTLACASPGAGLLHCCQSLQIVSLMTERYFERAVIRYRARIEISANAVAIRHISLKSPMCPYQA